MIQVGAAVDSGNGFITAPVWISGVITPAGVSLRRRDPFATSRRRFGLRLDGCRVDNTRT